jgi:aminobenzoyl-glutamate transport protein
MKKFKGFLTTIIPRFLNFIEKAGNLLPHPATLFAILAITVIVLSWIASGLSIEVLHPTTSEAIKPMNLLSKEGIGRILTNLVENFTKFAPLGTVLVAMLGIGVAEGSGLIGAALRLLVLSAPKKMMTFVIVLAGILSNTASEVGYVLLVPLAGIIFLALGRHPLAGLAAAFAGVSGGYSANLLLGTIDPLLAGLSQEAAHIIDPEYLVNPAANYYFMLISVPIIALAGTWVTEKLVIPRLGEYEGDEKPQTIEKLNKDEKRGLLWSAIAAIFVVLILLIGIIPENGILRGADGDILHSPFMEGIVAIIFLTGAIMGIAYGLGAKTLKSDADVMKGMGKSMEMLGSYIVLVFFAAQFVAFFNWTNLGKIFAVEGAMLLQSSGLGPIPLMISFIILTSMINLLMGSASAKWALMAPVFIPMFMLIGYTPEFVQAAYRIGDSASNIISPMMSYFALIVVFFQKYDKKAGIGTLVATMLPYTMVFFIAWSVLLVIWILLGLHVGPEAPMMLIDK